MVANKPTENIVVANLRKVNLTRKAKTSTVWHLDFQTKQWSKQYI